MGFSQLFVPNPSMTTISRNSFFFMLGLQDSQANHFIDDEIYNITCHNGRRNVTTGTVTKTPIPLEPCTEENLPDNKELQYYFKNLVGGAAMLKNIYCIKKGYDDVFSIKGEWDQDDFNYIQIQIFPCVSSSNHICKENQTMINQLKEGFFGFYSTDYLFDMLNYDQPARKFGRDYYIPTSYQLKKSIVRYLRTNRINTDDGWLMQDIHQKEYFSWDSDKETFNILSSELNGKKFLEMQIRKQYL